MEERPFSLRSSDQGKGASYTRLGCSVDIASGRLVYRSPLHWKSIKLSRCSCSASLRKKRRERKSVPKLGSRFVLWLRMSRQRSRLDLGIGSQEWKKIRRRKAFTSEGCRWARLWERGFDCQCNFILKNGMKVTQRQSFSFDSIPWNRPSERADLAGDLER